MGQPVQLKSLNGLRFAAILLVFIQHVQGHFGIPQLNLNFGHEATSLFFVLSGFVLTYSYHDRLSEPGQLREFYFSRWSRIWPLHAFCLILAVLLVLNPAEFFSSGTWPALLLSNLGLMHSWVPSSEWALSFNSVSWFLSVLVFCYAIFPLLVADQAKRVWLTLGVWGSVLLLAILVMANLLPHSWSEVKTSIVLFHPLVRGIEFVLGVGLGSLLVETKTRPILPHPESVSRFRTEAVETATVEFVEGTDIADLKVSRSTRKTERVIEEEVEMEVSSTDTLLEAVAIALVVGYFVSLIALRWDNSLSAKNAVGPMLAIGIRTLAAAILSSILMWAFAGKSGMVSALFSTPPVQYLGKISFAFFMTHLLVFRFLLKLEWNTQIPAIAVGGILLLMSLAIAILVHHLVEQPLRLLLERIEKRSNRVELPDRVALGEAILACRESGRSFLGGLITPPALVALAMLAFSGVAVYGGYSAKKEVPVKQYVGRPFFGKQPIGFQDEATLLALQATKTSEGVRLLMFWSRDPDSKRNRGIHLVGPNEKIVGYATQDWEGFSKRPANQEFKEELIVPNDKLSGVEKIGIGFFHPVHKGAPISRGPRSMNGRRLDIKLSDVFAD